MPEIRYQQPGAMPEIESAEIHIPDSNDLGTGTFTTVLKPRVLTTLRIILSVMMNAPSFQASAEIQGTALVIAKIGRADTTIPLSQKAFDLPGDIDIDRRHRVRVAFANWQIVGTFWDNEVLAERR